MSWTLRGHVAGPLEPIIWADPVGEPGPGGDLSPVLAAQTAAKFLTENLAVEMPADISVVGSAVSLNLSILSVTR